MQLNSPCKRCARRRADKNDCVKGCNAIALYNRNSEKEFTEKGIVKMEKELDKLSSEHAENLQLPEQVDNAEDKPVVKEKVECANPLCYGLAMIRRGTGEVVNGYCRDCTRAGFSKKKKGLDMIKTETGKVMNKKKVIKLTNKSKEIVLDLAGYPQIEAMLTEMSDKTMLPREHIVLSLIGDALARRME